MNRTRTPLGRPAAEILAAASTEPGYDSHRLSLRALCVKLAAGGLLEETNLGVWHATELGRQVNAELLARR